MSKLHVKRRARLALFCFLLSFPAYADWTGMSSRDFELADPPAPHSREYEKDFETLHRHQQSRDRKHCVLAGTQVHPTFGNFFGPSSGQLTESEYERVEPLMEKVFRVTSRISTYFKKQFARPRPYDVDDTIKPCVKRPGGERAYPSSHAALGTVGGCVLAKAFPRKAAKLREYGAYLGELRVIVGVHHPSDVAAGQALGKEICDKLLADGEFKEELGNL